MLLSQLKLQLFSYNCITQFNIGLYTICTHLTLITNFTVMSSLNMFSSSSSSSSSDCCAGQRSTPHSRTLEVRPGRITKKLGLRYDCDCERDETKSLLGVLMLGCDILIANDE